MQPDLIVVMEPSQNKRQNIHQKARSVVIVRLEVVQFSLFFAELNQLVGELLDKEPREEGEGYRLNSAVFENIFVRPLRLI